jgi:hypothetical protein
MSARGANKSRGRGRKKADLSYFGSSATCVGWPSSYDGETFPLLSAGQIGRAASAIVRLHDRKLLTRSERNRAWKRLTDEALK